MEAILTLTGIYTLAFVAVSMYFFSTLINTYIVSNQTNWIYSVIIFQFISIGFVILFLVANNLKSKNKLLRMLMLLFFALMLYYLGLFISGIYMEMIKMVFRNITCKKF